MEEERKGEKNGSDPLVKKTSTARLKVGVGVGVREEGVREGEKEIERDAGEKKKGEYNRNSRVI